jgi:hypothetical protein
MFVTGRKWWKFLSYRRGFPALLLTVERDEEIMRKIESAVASFCAKIDSEIARLGGEIK